GDGMMIFFNDPVPVPNAPERAVRMALAMRERARNLDATWRKQGYDLGMGIGIAQGYATIRAIGFEGPRDSGAIGTVPNTAARVGGHGYGDHARGAPLGAGEPHGDSPVSARGRSRGKRGRPGAAWSAGPQGLRPARACLPRGGTEKRMIRTDSVSIITGVGCG